MKFCITCGKQLNYNEIGATKKLINRGLTEFYCIPCLSKEIKLSEEGIRIRIERFKEQGCSLFI